MPIQIKSLKAPELYKYGNQIQALESLVSYPYGNDFFKIYHGQNYFSFFERMGPVTFNVALENQTVVACGAGVLRTIPSSQGCQKAWYLCDLKVHPDYTNQRLPFKLLKKGLIKNLLKAPRGYAISMNTSNGENRVIKLVKNFTWPKLQYSDTLNFYTFSREQILNYQNEIKQIVGEFSFLSLVNKKDLIMQSSGKSLPLLHMQQGRAANRLDETTRDGHLHMICALEKSPLDNLLSSIHKRDAQASIISFGMKYTDWNFILSSDI